MTPSQVIEKHLEAASALVLQRGQEVSRLDQIGGVNMQLMAKKYQAAIDYWIACEVERELQHIQLELVT